MSRIIKWVSVGALALGAFVVVPGAAEAGAAPSHSQAAGTTCTGTLTSPGYITTGTYSSLVMPPGSFCAVVGTVTVQKPLTLQSGSGLAVFGGSLTVDGPFTVDATGAFATFSNTTPVTIGGPVRIGTNGAFLLGTETPYGPRFASIGGPVTATNASSVQIHNTTIGGGVRLVGGGADNPLVQAFTTTSPFNNFNDLEDNQIGGGVTEIGYDGIWGGVLRNVIDGPFVFSNNMQSVADEYDIGSNFINGPAICNSNTPVPNMGHSAGAPSIVNGPIRGNQAATCTGVTTGVSGPAV